MLWVYSLLFSLKNARTKIFAAPAGLVRRMAAGASFAAVREILDDIVDHPLHVNEEGTREICSTYKDLERDGRLEFMRMLASDYSVKHQNILEKAEALVGVKERGDPVLYNCEKRLHVALTPKFLQLFQAIAKLPEGVKFVVDMRAELLEALQDNSLEDRWQELRKMNESLHDLLSLWFSVGFLHLQRVTWESSCDMMQKISSYEAVHPVRNWTDIKRRVGPYRRCYVFVHNSMPGEPIVVLHTALTESIATNVQSLVSLADTKNLQDEKEDPKKVVAANFYSITSTQRGLQGIELGYHLIKRTVTEILKEFSQLQQFSSLSPIPGFRSWLLGEINMYLSHPAEHSCPLSAGEVITIAYVFQIPADAPSVLTTIKHTLLGAGWMADEKLADAFQAMLMRLCAHYLYLEKHRGYALNYVANFHLSNGAMLWRINWLADTSARGFNRSCGMMVNYRYHLVDTDRNSRRYRQDFHIEVSEGILQLLCNHRNGLHSHFPYWKP